MMALHLREVPEPPSKFTDTQVPHELEGAILACLEKERDERPQTADELASRLVTCQTDSRWTAEQAQEWWARHASD